MSLRKIYYNKKMSCLHDFNIESVSGFQNPTRICTKTHTVYRTSTNPIKFRPIEFEYTFDNTMVDIEPRPRWLPTSLIKLHHNALTTHLAAFHIHHPSEHTIEEERFALEFHFVFERTPEFRTVFGYMFRVGEISDPLIIQLLQHAPIMVPPLHDYMSMTGSLTQPDYTTSVNWNISLVILTITEQDLATLIEQHMVQGSRRLFPREGRDMTLVCCGE